MNIVTSIKAARETKHPKFSGKRTVTGQNSGVVKRGHFFMSPHFKPGKKVKCVPVLRRVFIDNISYSSFKAGQFLIFGNNLTKRTLINKPFPNFFKKNLSGKETE